MDTRKATATSLATAFVAALALCACSRAAPDALAAKPDIPEADVEGSPLPPTIDPTVVQPPPKQLDWSMEGHDAIAAGAGDSEGREAALRYMRGRDHEASAEMSDAADAEGASSAEATPDDVAATASRSGASGDDAPRVRPERHPVARAETSEPGERDERIAVPAQTAPRVAGPRTQIAGTVSGDARSLNRQAISLINAGRPLQAIPLLEQAVARQPRDAEMLGNLGYAYMLAGEHQRARDRLRSAIDLSPTRSATWLNLGQTYAELGQQDVAVDAVVTGYRYSTRKASVRSALQRAVSGNRHSAAWREAAALALSRIG